MNTCSTFSVLHIENINKIYLIIIFHATPVPSLKKKKKLYPCSCASYLFCFFIHIFNLPMLLLQQTHKSEDKYEVPRTDKHERKRQLLEGENVCEQFVLHLHLYILYKVKSLNILGLFLCTVTGLFLFFVFLYQFNLFHKIVVIQIIRK